MADIRKETIKEILDALDCSNCPLVSMWDCESKCDAVIEKVKEMYEAELGGQNNE